jgi:hypothetical protein
MVGGVGVWWDSSTLTGLSIGGVGVFAPKVRAAAVSITNVRAQDVRAIVLSGVYFKVASSTAERWLP